MSRFAEHADLRKAGIIRLEEVGAYVVIANKKLYDLGRAGRFAVANAREHWVDSVHSTRAEALSLTQKLSAH
ncbi:MAG: hypothetical protein ACRDHG_06715 [Anaerolineales bacterium]